MTETLIFDEVDAGIGGSLGEKVGRKLKQLARIHQVLCITHLPQIAAFADSHYQVIKKVKAKRTFTEIKALNEEERLLELARMLSGTSPSESTKILAGELFEKVPGAVRSLMDCSSACAINPKKSGREPAIGPLAALVAVPGDLKMLSQAIRPPGELRFKNSWLRCYHWPHPSRFLTLAGPVLGSPQAVMVLEKLIVLGAGEYCSLAGPAV